MFNRAHSFLDTEVQARSAVRMSRNVGLGSWLPRQRPLFPPWYTDRCAAPPSAADPARRKDLDEVGALREILPGAAVRSGALTVANAPGRDLCAKSLRSSSLSRAREASFGWRRLVVMTTLSSRRRWPCWRQISRPSMLLSNQSRSPLTLRTRTAWPWVFHFKNKGGRSRQGAQERARTSRAGASFTP